MEEQTWYWLVRCPNAPDGIRVGFSTTGFHEADTGKNFRMPCLACSEDHFVERVTAEVWGRYMFERCGVCAGRGIVAGAVDDETYDAATGDVECPQCQGAGYLR